VQGDREWELWSVHHTLSLLLFPPQEEDSSLTSHAPMWGPSHARQSSTNCSNVSPSHGLQVFTNCSTVGPFHRLQPFRNRLLQCGSTMGSQVLPASLLWGGILFLHGSTGPARSLLLHELPMGSQPPSGTHLLRCGVLCALQVEICSTVDLHGLQVDNLPHHGLLHRLQGNLCSGTWNTSSPSFFTDLGVYRAVSLTYSHSSFLLQFTPPSHLHKHIITEALPLLLMGWTLASAGSVLELGGFDSIGHRGASSSFSQKLPLWPPHYQNFATQTQYIYLH